MEFGCLLLHKLLLLSLSLSAPEVLPAGPFIAPGPVNNFRGPINFLCPDNMAITRIEVGNRAVLVAPSSNVPPARPWFHFRVSMTMARRTDSGPLSVTGPWVEFPLESASRARGPMPWTSQSTTRCVHCVYLASVVLAPARHALATPPSKSSFFSTLVFQCPSLNGKSYALTGFISPTYSTGTRDRVFQFQCCELQTTCTETCTSSVEANAWDAPMDFRVPPGQFLAGTSSVHDNFRE